MLRNYKEDDEIGYRETGGGAATGNFTSDLCTETGVPTACSTSLRNSGGLLAGL